MTDQTLVRIVLASRPEGAPVPENFRIERAAVSAPADGDVLLKVRYLSLDPYMRGRMSAAKSYAAPVEIGGVMEGGTVAEVIDSRRPDFAVGDIVLSHSGWQTHALSNGEGLRKLDPGRRACLDCPGRAGHAWFHRLGGFADHRQAAAGRDRRGGCGQRAGRLGGGPDRQDQGRAGSGDRRRRE